jgi:hypothetical protein
MRFLTWQALFIGPYVKGIYYQAEVMGQQVTWLTPHSLAQTLPEDVDYRVMLTFLEFYIAMMVGLPAADCLLVVYQCTHRHPTTTEARYRPDCLLIVYQ